jgi:hypothetical protein
MDADRHPGCTPEGRAHWAYDDCAHTADAPCIDCIAAAIRAAERAAAGRERERAARYLEGLTTRKADGEWVSLGGAERALIKLLAESIRALPPA